MSRPSFQWYPDDWLTDLGLRRCSIEARGLWVDLICLMHQGTPYGYLTDKNGALPVKFVAQNCGISVKKLSSLMHELETTGVFSRDENGAIFSRRMVRDEQVRQARSLGGSRSLENPNVPRPKQKDTHEGYPSGGPKRMGQVRGSHAEDGDVDTDSQAKKKAESKSSERFAEFWSLYPRKFGQQEAVRDWLSVVTSENETAVFACLGRYLASRDVQGGAVMSAGSSMRDVGWLIKCSRDNWESDWPAPRETKQAPVYEDVIERAKRAARARGELAE